jgi:hypothetical protein
MTIDCGVVVHGKIKYDNGVPVKEIESKVWLRVPENQQI